MGSRIGLGILGVLAGIGAAWAADPPASLLAVADVGYCRGHGATATAALLDRLGGPVLVAGDVAYPKGREKDIARCFEPTWGRHKERIWPVPGNHDYITPQAGPYFDYWGARVGKPGEGYYSFDHAGWHIIGLNSNIDATDGSAQVAWLRRDLQAAKNRCVLAQWHHPVFGGGVHRFSPEMLPAFRALHAAGASVVVNGHEHVYGRLKPLDPGGKPDAKRGLRTFIVGTGGAPLQERRTIGTVRAVSNEALGHSDSDFFANDRFGVLHLSLSPDRYQWEFVPADGGEPIDRGAAHCNRRDIAAPAG